MATYQELLQQREALSLQIEAARKKEISDAVARVRAIVTEYGLKPDDVFGKRRGHSGLAGVKVAPKYRDPATGKTWTGRGKAPRWIEGRDRSQFAIS